MSEIDQEFQVDTIFSNVIDECILTKESLLRNPVQNMTSHTNSK